MKRGSKAKKWIGPVGSGYFLLLGMGMLLVVFAMSLITLPIANTFMMPLLVDKPCLSWVLIIVLLMTGLLLYWLGYRQGFRSM